MTRSIAISGALLVAALLVAVPFLRAAPPEERTVPAKTTQADVDRALTGWPQKSAEVARTIIEKYGLPDEASPSRLMWTARGPWKRTIVHREPVAHRFPMEHVDILEQVVDLKVPADKYDEIATYDGSVFIQRTTGEISARCDQEAMNLLALNLAHDIATGKKTVDVARNEYADTAMAAKRGELRPYTQKLQFEPHTGRSADPDVPFEQRGAVR